MKIIYCPLTKDWERAKDCGACEMCGDDQIVGEEEFSKIGIKQLKALKP